MTIIIPDKATSTVPPQQPFHILILSPAYSASSRYFHLPLCYEDHSMERNVSLDTANIKSINISNLDFSIWHHFSRNWTPFHLQKMASIPEVLVTQLCRYIINTSEPNHSFTIEDDDKEPSLIWKILTHPGTYIGTIGMLFAVSIGFYCFERLWIRPATPRQ